MCEYTPDCTKTTDPLAKALSENPREKDAVVRVLCPIRYHLLAAVYDLPHLGGFVLCQPHMKVRRGSFFLLEPSDDPDELIHWHPTLTPLTSFDVEVEAYGRCRCGTWHYKPSHAMEVVERVRAGTWEGIAEDTFVKVRNDATGRTSQLSRAYAEKFVIPKGGHTIVGRAPRSERLRRPYTLGSYVSMADAPTK